MTEAEMRKAGASSPAWTLTVLFLIYSFHYVDRGVMSVVLEPMKREFALSDTQLGLLTGLGYALTYAIVGLPVGYLIDRTNRRNLLAALLAGWSVLTLLCGISRGFWSLAVARLAVGATESGGAPASVSIIMDSFPPNRRSGALGIFYMSPSVGAMIVFIVGGLIVGHFGWRFAFFVAGGPGLLLAFLLLFTVREPARGEAEGVRSRDNVPAVTETLLLILQRPTVLCVFLAMTFSAVAGTGVHLWIVSFFIRVHGMSISQVGPIVGVVIGICGALGSLLGGAAANWVGKRDLRNVVAIPAVGAALSVLALSALAWVPGPVEGTIAFGVFIVTFSTYFGPGHDLLLRELHPRMRGLAVSIMELFTILVGYGLGPFLIGSISDLAGGQNSLRFGMSALLVADVIATAIYFVTWKLARNRPQMDWEDV